MSMMTMKIKGQKSWELMQVKTFTGWVNFHLMKRQLQIADLAVDFDDGIKLIQLIEILSGESLGKYNKKPGIRVQKVENLNLALSFINDFVHSQGISLSYSAENILDHNLTLILGMTWVLISKFQVNDISEEELSARDGLLLWCQKKTKGYKGVSVENFNLSWQSGLAFCALIHKHRPDLLDYDSLNEDDWDANLEKAFDVAEASFGIPKLLDVKDMTTMLPDDKSVMTYVSFYWKVFSKDQQTELAARRLKKLVETQKKNESLRTNYEELARALIEWMDMQTKTFTAMQVGSSMAEVEEKTAEFVQYKRAIKPAKAASKLEAEATFSSLTSRLRSQGRPAYVPPEGLTVLDIYARWTTLIAAERAYDAGLREALRIQKSIHNILLSFEKLASKLEKWMAEKAIYLSDLSVIKDLGVAQARIKVQEAFEDEFAQYRPRLDRLASLVAKLMEVALSMTSESGIIALPPDRADAVQSRLSAIQSQWGVLETQGGVKRKFLEEQLATEQERDANRLKFAKLAESFSMWNEDTQDILTEPMACDSLEDVAARQVTADAAAADISAHAPELETLQSLSAAVEADEVPNPYTRFVIAMLTASFDETNANLKSRMDAIAAELAVQTRNDELRQEYAAKAQEANKIIETLSSKLKAVDGDLNDQFAAVSSLAAEATNGQNLIQSLEAVNVTLTEAKVTDNKYTDITLEEVLSQWEQLQTSIRDTLSRLEREVSLSKSGEVSAEQLREFKEAFDFFDKSRDGRLQIHEFKACLNSLEIDVSDAEVEATVKKNDKSGNGTIEFNEFLDYMLQCLKDSDTEEQINGAFRHVADNGDAVTATQLAKVLDAEDILYLKIQMRVETDDGPMDYKTFTAQVYRR